MKIYLQALALALVLSVGVLHASAADVVGAWKLVLVTEIGDRPMPMDLSQQGEDVTAKMGDIPLSGTFKEGKLRLVAKKYYVADAGFEADLILEGTVDGDKVTGTWAFGEYNGVMNGQRGGTAAAASASAAKADGTWNVVFVTEAGNKEAQLSLTSDGEAVSGSAGPQKVEGTFRDGSLALKLPKFYSADAGFTADLLISGKVDGNALQGQWTFGEYSGIAKGTRSAQ